MSYYSSVEPARPEAEAFLHGLPLFSSLAPEQLVAIAGSLKRRSFAPGVTIFHQDMPGSTLYLIEAGFVRLAAIGRTGQEITLNILGAGDVFGLLSVLDRQPHAATAITLVQTCVWLLSWSAIEPEYPALVRPLILLLTARLRAADHNLETMFFEDVLGRLAFQLLTLAERHGRQSEQGIEIGFPLTQGILATLIGATRESVNKAVSILRADNLLRMDGHNLTILEIQGLARLIEERRR